jgi:hypothetical protein
MCFKLPFHVPQANVLYILYYFVTIIQLLKIFTIFPPPPPPASISLYIEFKINFMTIL